MNKVMFAVIFLLFTCCKKDEKKPDETIPVKITEPVSGSPVTDARVILFRCTGNYGCYGSIEIFSGMTDESGICKVPLDDFNDVTVHMTVIKEKYWPYIEMPHMNEVTLTPEGWIPVKVHNDGGYPAQSNLIVYAVSENGRTGDTEINVLPNDTTIWVRAFGDEQNKLVWQLNAADNSILNHGEISGLSVTKFDTTASLDLHY